jgi:hypothetical protein
MFDDAFDFDPFDVEALEAFSYGQASQDKPEDNFVMEGLEPFFYNKAQSERWAEEEMERQRRKKVEEEQMEAEKEQRSKAHKEVRESIMEFAPRWATRSTPGFFSETSLSSTSMKSVSLFL